MDGLPPCKVVELEAFHHSKDKTFSSFLCLLALSSVIGKPIQLLYPDAGLPKFKKIFNSLIKPRDSGKKYQHCTFYFFTKGFKVQKFIVLIILYL
jgi:hypothetical protein